MIDRRPPIRRRTADGTFEINPAYSQWAREHGHASVVFLAGLDTWVATHHLHAGPGTHGRHYPAATLAAAHTHATATTAAHAWAHHVWTNFHRREVNGS